LGALAQHIELISEADVTFSVTYQTSVPTTTGTGATRSVSTRVLVSKLSNADIIKSIVKELKDAQNNPVETDPAAPGWSFLAVRSLPADLYEVNGDFALYAAKGTQRVAVPTALFSASANPSYLGITPSVTRGVLTHSTRNIVRASGTSTFYTELALAPAFTREAAVTGPAAEEPAPGGGVRRFNVVTTTSTRFTVESMFATGFASIPFRTPNQALTYSPPADSPVTFFIIGPNARLTTRGDFSGVLTNTVKRTKVYTFPRGFPAAVIDEVVDATPTPNVGGLVEITVTVGAPILVPRSNYDITDPESGEIVNPIPF
jgi:hypothetical protein